MTWVACYLISDYQCWFILLWPCFLLAAGCIQLLISQLIGVPLMSNKRRAKKSYNANRKLAKFTHSRASKIYCYDGKCFPEMQFGGDPLKAMMPDHIKKKIMYSVGEDVHHWNIMLLIFEEYEGGKQAIVADIIPETIGRSNDLNRMLDGDLERRVNARKSQKRDVSRLVCCAIKEC